MNGLEALEEIVKYYNLEMGSDEYYAVRGAYETIEKELKDGENHKKALKIIKKKVDERRIVLENDFDNRFSLGGLELCDLTYDELATILECFDFENIKVVNGKIQLSLTNRELEK